MKVSSSCYLVAPTYTLILTNHQHAFLILCYKLLIINPSHGIFSEIAGAYCTQARELIGGTHCNYLFTCFNINLITKIIFKYKKKQKEKFLI